MPKYKATRKQKMTLIEAARKKLIEKRSRNVGLTIPPTPPPPLPPPPPPPSSPPLPPHPPSPLPPQMPSTSQTDDNSPADQVVPPSLLRSQLTKKLKTIYSDYDEKYVLTSSIHICFYIYCLLWQ